jgi:hypothetical protein
LLPGRLRGGIQFGQKNGQEQRRKCLGVKPGTGSLEKQKTAGLGIKRRHFSNRPLPISDGVVYGSSSSRPPKLEVIYQISEIRVKHSLGLASAEQIFLDCEITDLIYQI